MSSPGRVPINSFDRCLSTTVGGQRSVFFKYLPVSPSRDSGFSSPIVCIFVAATTKHARRYTGEPDGAVMRRYFKMRTTQTSPQMLHSICWAQPTHLCPSAEPSLSVPGSCRGRARLAALNCSLLRHPPCCCALDIPIATHLQCLWLRCREVAPL